MKNYVTLNGVKSTTLKGLIIQELPPISKPKIKTQVEEIDGRDGDIVTKLGYQAYDREMKIGLYGDYDLDEIIGYFDSEGEAIFSNEPERIYRYQVTESIDFERLIRFRTAAVTFHVQPFKHSTVDHRQEFNGNSALLSNFGNVVARPRITVYGTGTVNIFINGDIALIIEMGNEEYITIDAEEMNAYKDGTFKNRNVVGDYDNLALKPGKTLLTWSGATKIVIENYSRWV